MWQRVLLAALVIWRIYECNEFLHCYHHLLFLKYSISLSGGSAGHRRTPAAADATISATIPWNPGELLNLSMHEAGHLFSKAC